MTQYNPFPKRDEPLPPKKEEPRKPAPQAEKKPEPKKEEPPRRNRVSVLRDLVEDLESDSSFSDEQRKAFMELNRRLTRALAR